MNKTKAIAVLSGGLDSTVAMSYYTKDYEILGLTFNYGQKAVIEEINAAKKICKYYNIKHTVINLKWLDKISNSALNTAKKIPQPTLNQLDDEQSSKNSANKVWVPGRNIVFTAIAISFAESINAKKIIVGWDKEEANTFPDNSKEFLKSFNELINIGSPNNIEIVAPAIDLNKEEIVKLGKKMSTPLELTYSCYTGNKKHCGMCESCMRRKRGFKKAKIQDLTEYEI